MSIEDPNKVNEDLTEEQLFSRISRSINENDFETLDALVIPDQEKEVTEPEVTEPVAVETAPEVVSQEPEVVEPEVKPEEVKPSDWTAGLPKEAQEELSRLRLVEQRMRSESGRVPFLQKKLAELEKKLQSEPAATAAVSDGKPTSKELEDALAQIAEVDPVTARAFNLLRQEAISSVKKTETILEQRDEEALLAREFEKLTQVVPQAPQVFQLPEWSEWKESQSPGLRALASSSYADDVVVAMEKFAKDMAIKYPEFVNQTTPTQPKEEVREVVPVVDAKQVALEEQRNRRLAATTPASPVPAKTAEAEPKDAEALFAHYSKMIMKEDHLDRRK